MVGVGVEDDGEGWRKKGRCLGGRVGGGRTGVEEEVEEGEGFVMSK